MNIGTLSYRAQVLRLRQLAHVALERYAIPVRGLHFINHGENTTFQILSTRGQKYLLRIHRLGYHTAAAVLEEIESLARLRGKIPAPEPVRSKAGRLLESVSGPGIDHPRNVSVFKWLNGRFISQPTSLKRMRDLGALVARFHTLEVGTRVRHRRYWDAEGLIGTKPKFGSVEELPGASHSIQRTITQGRRKAFKHLKSFERRHPDRMGFIHADLHFRNVLVSNNALGFIDFDDSGFGFHAYDLAVPLQALHSRFPKLSLKAYTEAICEGYAHVRSWDKDDAAILPHLMVARRLSMLGWMKTRSDNPKIFKRLKAFTRDNATFLKREYLP